MNKQALFILLSTAFFCWPASHLYAQQQPDPGPVGQVKAHVWPQKITVRVVDEEGLPVEGADVGIGMSDAVGFDHGYNVTAGKSDAQGRMSAEAPGDGHAEITAVKEGFYRSRLRYDWDVDLFDDYDGISEFKVPAGYRANPWNPEVELMLVRIGDRVPLSMRGMPGGMSGSITLPAMGQEFKYDLVLGDFVEPHGKGLHTDLVLKTHIEVVEGIVWNSVLEINLVGEGNGLLPLERLPHRQSAFRYLRSAPDNEYELRHIVRRAQVASPMNTSDPRYLRLQQLKSDPQSFLRMEAQVGGKQERAHAEAWIFRIRTELEPDSAGPIYGIILSPVQFAFDERNDKGWVGIRAVLNPEPGSRILEQLDPEPTSFPPAVPEAGASPATPGL